VTEVLPRFEREEEEQGNVFTADYGHGILNKTRQRLQVNGGRNRTDRLDDFCPEKFHGCFSSGAVQDRM
jgi:hypothetical protein